MSRIFDAIKKAASVLPVAPAPPAPAPIFEPSLGPAGPAARPARARAAGPILGFPLAGMLEPADDELQQMTSLRVNLESALPERAVRVVAFVSSQSGEGTTTVAHQFAATLTRDERQRTVIVDANARNPSLEYDPEHRVARFLGRASEPGAPDGIALNLHGWPLPEEIRRGGLMQPSAARAVVEGLSGSYDWVILDVPSVLETPDAAALAAVADGAVLVVQAGRTKRPVVGRAADLLRRAGARVLGSVLNRRRLEIPEFIYKRI